MEWLTTNGGVNSDMQCGCLMLSFVIACWFVIAARNVVWIKLDNRSPVSPATIYGALLLYHKWILLPVIISMAILSMKPLVNSSSALAKISYNALKNICLVYLNKFMCQEPHEYCRSLVVSSSK